MPVCEGREGGREGGWVKMCVKAQEKKGQET